MSGAYIWILRNLVKIHEKPALAEIETLLTAFLRDKGEISPPEFREITGLSRKFMIPVLEYFDARKVTIRLGDKRVLQKK